MLGLLLLGYLLPHILILSEERFHLALVPFAAIAAAPYFTTWPQRPQPWWRKEILVPAGITILLLTNWIYQFSSEAAKYAVLLGPNGNHSPFPY